MCARACACVRVCECACAFCAYLAANASQKESWVSAGNNAARLVTRASTEATPLLSSFSLCGFSTACLQCAKNGCQLMLTKSVFCWCKMSE